MVVDGARVEETLGEGWSDAAGAPTAWIWPGVRDRLVPEGIVVGRALQAGRTLTQPAHVDLATGARSGFMNLAVGDDPGWFRPERPTLFETLRRAGDLDPDAAVLVANTRLVGPSSWSLHPGLGEGAGATFEFLDTPDDTRVLDRAVDRLLDGARLAVVNLHHVDVVGHDAPVAYAGAVAAVDAPLVAAWTRLADAGLDVLLVVMADHGRHRSAPGRMPWSDHGCACSGCREIPLLLVGAGVGSGDPPDGPALLEDVTATAARVLGVDLPLARGRPLVGAPAGPPSGPWDLDADGGLRVDEIPVPSGDPRTRILAGDAVLTDDGAWLAEAPRVATGAGAAYACWRELTVDPAEDGWTWEARCLGDPAGAAPADLGFPLSPVGPDHLPDLVVGSDGALWLAAADVMAPDGTGRTVAEDGFVRLLRWSSPEGWTAPHGPSPFLVAPGPPSLALDGDRPFVAVAASDDHATARGTRHVEIWAPNAAGLGGWTRIRRVPEDAPGARAESPALRAAKGAIAVGWLSTDGSGTRLLLDRTDAAGAWTGPVGLDTTGRVLPSIRPAWDASGGLWWARLDGDDAVEACRHADGATACAGTGRTWIGALAPADGGAWAALSDGAGVWEAILLPPPGRR